MAESVTDSSFETQLLIPQVITYYVFWLSADEHWIPSRAKWQWWASNRRDRVNRLSTEVPRALGRPRCPCSFAWRPPFHRFCQHSVLPRRSRAALVLGGTDRVPLVFAHRFSRARSQPSRSLRLGSGRRTNSPVPFCAPSRCAAKGLWRHGEKRGHCARIGRTDQPNSAHHGRARRTGRRRKLVENGIPSPRRRSGLASGRRRAIRGGDHCGRSAGAIAYLRQSSLRPFLHR